MPPWNLRPDVMFEPHDDGGATLVDPLFERVLRLSPADVAALDAGEPHALARLDARHLRVGPLADALRRAAWHARMRPEPTPRTLDEADTTLLAEAAAALPWTPAWQDAERWRRLIERGRTGAAPLFLDALFPEALAHAAAAEAAVAPRERMSTPLIDAERALVGEATPASAGWMRAEEAGYKPDDDSSQAPTGRKKVQRRGEALPSVRPGRALGTLRAALSEPALRAALGAALARDLTGALHLNAWRLGPGERMGVHPDGAGYAGTVVVGLAVGWCAADGGAIAFGVPGPEGLGVNQRWLPHAGDVLVFAPGPDTWHCVEPARRERYTLSGWWQR